jgi:hypothetical protein
VIFRDGYFDINRTSKREEGFDINGDRLIITDNLGLLIPFYPFAILEPIFLIHYPISNPKVAVLLSIPPSFLLFGLPRLIRRDIHFRRLK